MTVIAKTQGIELVAHQAVTHPGTVVGSAYDVTGAMAASIFCYHAFVEAAANTNPGSFLIQASPHDTGNETWATISTIGTSITTADTEAMTATEPVGETSLAVAFTTDFVPGDILYIQDTGTLANSEWNRCQEIVTDTSIELIDGLTNAKDSSDIIWNDAQQTVVTLDTTAYRRLRVVFQHEGAAGANVHIHVLMILAERVQNG